MPLFRSKSALIYFSHIPKTGGSSVEMSLLKMGARVALLNAGTKGYSKCTLQHIHSDISDIFFKEGFYDSSFAVCRNPFARIRSEYLMRKHGKNNPPGFDQWLDESLNRYRENEYVYDNHIRPQVEFLLDDIEIFKLEDGLEAVIAYAAERLSLEPLETIPKKRVSQDEEVVASSDSIARIIDFYSQDFSVLNYDRSDVFPLGVR